MSTSQRIAKVLARLEKYDPDDDYPAATRATLAYVRILEAEGPIELVKAIQASVTAGITALAVIAPTTKEAILAFAEITLRVSNDIRDGLATEGTPK